MSYLPLKSDCNILGAVQAICPEGLFRCGNGQCIDPLYKCNGKKDCNDGSDESVALCGPVGKTQHGDIIF